MTIELTLTMPTATELRRDGEGKAVLLEWDKIGANVAAAILVAGAKTVLTNAYNGGGKAATEAEKLAALLKKRDAWYAGEFNVIGRGESAMTALREQYIDERREATSQSRKQVETAIKALVAAKYGKDEPATFARFLDAVALHAEPKSDVARLEMRERIENDLAERAAKAAAKRADAAKDVNVDGIDFGF